MTTRVTRRQLACLALAAAVLTSAPLQAEMSVEELAKLAQNPVGNLISVPFQNNTNFGVGPQSGTQNILNIQPVIPITINSDWNVITRTIMPLIWQPGTYPGQGTSFGLGDVQMTGFVSPSKPGPGGLIWGAGPIVQMPTNTNDLGNKNWGLGPSAVVLRIQHGSPWVYGVLVNNIWSLSSDNAGGAYNNGLIQPFLNYNFKGGLYLTSAPIATVNWKADSDQAWTVPLGGGVGKIFHLGKLPVNTQLSAYYNVVHPDYGANWQMRAQVQLMFPEVNTFDYDWLIVGSGFGGSVSALRLAEKGYKVGVLEAGRRYRDEDYAKTTWDLKRFLWAPAIGLRGIFRLTPFKDVFIASGAAVGGGSVVYANTLYRASPDFFVNPQWAGINDWSTALAPHYDTAEKMLGVQTVPHQSDGQDLLKEVGKHFGVEHTFSRTPVGVFFGKPGTTVPDPYFGGEGPARSGCTRCGACMVGCREGAKNTLVKNYLWFAEKRGVEIHPEREVVDIRPIGAEDGADGYTVTTDRPGAWFRRQRRTFTARGIVISAGALGTNKLLARCKLGGSLPGISDRLGHLVRTNSESILAVTLPEGMARPWNDVAISASIYPRADTHIEFVTYGKHGDFMSLLYTLITGKGTRVTRPIKWLGQIVRHPLTFLKTLWPVGWSERSVLFLVMQSLDNAISFRAKRGLFGGVSLKTEQDPEKPNPTFIDVANQAAEWLAERTGGYAQSMVLEAWANVPTTAHILGGAVIGRDASSGVVDPQSRLFGYRNFLVCDGSTVPANPGVNPSLTITAMTEHAMSQIPARAS